MATVSRLLATRQSLGIRLQVMSRWASWDAIPGPPPNPRRSPVCVLHDGLLVHLRSERAEVVRWTRRLWIPRVCPLCTCEGPKPHAQKKALANPFANLQ